MIELTKKHWFSYKKHALYPANIWGWITIIAAIVSFVLILFITDATSHSVSDSLIGAFPYISEIVIVALLIAYLNSDRKQNWFVARKYSLTPISLAWQGHLMMLSTMLYTIYLVMVIIYTYQSGNSLTFDSSFCLLTTLLIISYLFAKTTKRT